MTIEELKNQLKELQKGSPEKVHVIADRLLLEYIDNEAITIAFTCIPFC